GEFGRIEPRRRLLRRRADERREGCARGGDSECEAVWRRDRPEVVHQRERARARHVLDDDGRLARDVAADVLTQKLRVGVVAAARAEAHINGHGLAPIEVGNRVSARRLRAEPCVQDDEAGETARHGQSPQTSRATSTIRASLARSIGSSTAIWLVALVEKPHCGLSASCSSLMKRLASSIRRLSASALSSSATLVATRPRPTTLPPGTAPHGSQPPPRAVSP